MSAWAGQEKVTNILIDSLACCAATRSTGFSKACRKYRIVKSAGIVCAFAYRP